VKPISLDASVGGISGVVPNLVHSIENRSILDDWKVMGVCDKDGAIRSVSFFVLCF